MPEDFVDAVSAQLVGKIGAPFQTKLGWHLVEVTEQLPEREASFEEMRDEIRAHLASQKRKDVIAQIVRDLRKRSKIWPPDPKPAAILKGT
jgi:parvulin-like peptidyl-prolyl isomerase